MPTSVSRRSRRDPLGAPAGDSARRRRTGRLVSLLLTLASLCLVGVTITAPAAAADDDTFVTTTSCNDGSPGGMDGFTGDSDCANRIALVEDDCTIAHSDAPGGATDTLTTTCTWAPAQCGEVALTGRQVHSLLVGVGYETLTTARQKKIARDNVCTALAWFDGSNYELVALLPTTPASEVGAGPAAPKGAYAKPESKRPDGTPTACPYYAQNAVYRATQDIVNIPLMDKLWVWVQRNVFGRPEAQVTPSFNLRKGAAMLTLRINVQACTQKRAFTDISPAAGSDPDWRGRVADPARALGYVEPTSLLSKSHNFTNAPRNTKFESSARAVFDYSGTIAPGVELPDNFTKLSTKTLGVKLTIYGDGTWDYALEGTN